MDERQRIEIEKEAELLKDCFEISARRMQEIDNFVAGLFDEELRRGELLQKVWNSDLTNSETCYTLYQIGFVLGEYYYVTKGGLK